MLNQKVVIYIILSAILLYLYYKRGDLAIFGAFVVVVLGTMFASGSGSTRTREGLSLGGGGGGDGGDKQCAKLGFKPVKLDKDELVGSLEKEMKKIKTIAEKHWPYDDMGGKTEDEKKKKALENFMKEFQKEAQEMTDSERKSLDMFVMGTVTFFEKQRMNEVAGLESKAITALITGGKNTLKLLEKLSKSDTLESDFKKTLNYLICLSKHWINIYKAIQKAKGGGGKDGGDDDDGDGEKKNKKKTTTKKKKKDDEEDEDKEGDEE
jgi:hypothetical protein